MPTFNCYGLSFREAYRCAGGYQWSRHSQILTVSSILYIGMGFDFPSFPLLWIGVCVR